MMSVLVTASQSMPKLKKEHEEPMRRIAHGRMRLASTLGRSVTFSPTLLLTPSMVSTYWS
jgi:hypothetical protein